MKNSIRLLLAVVVTALFFGGLSFAGSLSITRGAGAFDAGPVIRPGDNAYLTSLRADGGVVAQTFMFPDGGVLGGSSSQWTTSGDDIYYHTAADPGFSAGVGIGRQWGGGAPTVGAKLDVWTNITDYSGWGIRLVNNASVVSSSNYTGYGWYRAGGGTYAVAARNDSLKIAISTSPASEPTIRHRFAESQLCVGCTENTNGAKGSGEPLYVNGNANLTGQSTLGTSIFNTASYGGTAKNVIQSTGGEDWRYANTLVRNTTAGSLSGIAFTSATDLGDQPLHIGYNNTTARGQIFFHGNGGLDIYSVHGGGAVPYMMGFFKKISGTSAGSGQLCMGCDSTADGDTTSKIYTEGDIALTGSLKFGDGSSMSSAPPDYREVINAYAPYGMGTASTLNNTNISQHVWHPDVDGQIESARATLVQTGTGTAESMDIEITDGTTVFCTITIACDGAKGTTYTPGGSCSGTNVGSGDSLYFRIGTVGNCDATPGLNLGAAVRAL